MVLPSETDICDECQIALSEIGAHGFYSGILKSFYYCLDCYNAIFK